MPTLTENASVIYTAKAHSTGGRDGGASRTSDGRLDVKFSIPGGPGNGTNPEQLFAAGWATCFIGAMRNAAGRMKLHFPTDVAIDTEIDLCKSGEEFFIKARHNISIPSLDRQTAEQLIQAADKICPYSKATRGNIEAEINLV